MPLLRRIGLCLFLIAQACGGGLSGSSDTTSSDGEAGLIGGSGGIQRTSPIASDDALGETGTLTGAVEIAGTSVESGGYRPTTFPAGVTDPSFIIIAKVAVTTTDAVISGSVSYKDKAVGEALVTATLTRASQVVTVQTSITSPSGTFAMGISEPQQGDVIFAVATKEIEGVQLNTNTVKLEIDFFGKVDAAGNPIFGTGGANNIGPATLNVPVDVAIGTLTLPSTALSRTPALKSLASGTKVMFVADQDNNRVLGYNLDAANPRFAQVVIGQSNFVSVMGASGMPVLPRPRSIALDTAGNRLFVASMMNRIDIYDLSSGLTSGMTSARALGSSATGQATVNDPVGMDYDPTNHRLFVADRYSNRVLVYNVGTSIDSITNNMNASVVLGQSDFSSTGPGSGSTGFFYPTDVAWDPNYGRLYVSDYLNYRVMVFTEPLSNGKAASLVIGKTDFTTASTTSFARSASSIRLALSPDGEYLFVAEIDRIKRFPVGSNLANGPAADLCPGQKNNSCEGFAIGSTTTTEIAGKLNMADEGGMAVDPESGDLMITDTNHNRVLEFCGLAAGKTALACDGFGQVKSDGSFDPTALGVNAIGSSSFNSPTAMLIANAEKKLFVADTGNRRVLAYDLKDDYTLKDRLADYALGSVAGAKGPTVGLSSEFYSTEKLVEPRSFAYADGFLLVGDRGLQRISVFDLSQLETGMKASYVIGANMDPLIGDSFFYDSYDIPPELALDPTGRYLFLNAGVASSQGGNYSMGSNTKLICLDLKENNVSLRTRMQTYASTGQLTPYSVVETGITGVTGYPLTFSHSTVSPKLFFSNMVTNMQTGMSKIVIRVFSFAGGCSGLTELHSRTISFQNMMSMSFPTRLALSGDDQYLFVSNGHANAIGILAVSDLLKASSDSLPYQNVLGARSWSDAAGSADRDKFMQPNGLALTPDTCNLFVADMGNHRGAMVKKPLASGLAPITSDCP